MIGVLRPCIRICKERGIHTNNCLFYFYEPIRSDFPVVHDKLPEKKNLSFFGKCQNGYRQFKEECSLLFKEIRQHFAIHRTIVLHNVDDIVWKFNGTEKSLNQWVTTCDSDYNQGYSTAQLELSSSGTGIFHGVLSTAVTKDGITARAGYCNITTTPKRKSFKRKAFFDWSHYNCLVLRVRGDGRCYMLNILQRGRFDMTWYDAYYYVMYTRGGPYWQYVKIPFSKFVYAGKGVIQDSQQRMFPTFITNFGITLSDQKEGPFKLEIDYIGVCNDLCQFEEFAYEMFDMSK